ncbi:MAG TPA: cupin domain-containing protein [Lysobacter sp.]|nr:cupin domain-containing protein [Lysobacter sp.]
MPDAHPKPVAIEAEAVPARTTSLYPEPFASMVAGRAKRALGEVFGLKNFGVNLTRLAPGSRSALRHAHSHQDEFVFVLEGTATLVTDVGENVLLAGMCAGFAAGSGDAHQLVNRSDSDVVYLEIGDRSAGDDVTYPDDDLAARMVDGRWRFLHKDGRPY